MISFLVLRARDGQVVWGYADRETAIKHCEPWQVVYCVKSQSVVYHG